MSYKDFILKHLDEDIYNSVVDAMASTMAARGYEYLNLPALSSYIKPKLERSIVSNVNANTTDTIEDGFELSDLSNTQYDLLAYFFRKFISDEISYYHCTNGVDYYLSLADFLQGHIPEKEIKNLDMS